MLSCVVCNDVQLDPKQETEVQLEPQERIQNVKPYWASLSDEEGVQVLSISLEELRLRAYDMTENARKQAGAPCLADLL